MTNVIAFRSKAGLTTDSGGYSMEYELLGTAPRPRLVEGS